MIGLRKKDKVKILSGKDKGKQGEVLKVFPHKGRVIVSKINFVKRHTRPSQTAPGGIHEKESPLAISKIMLICPKCSQTTRQKMDYLSDGKKIRLCRRCGEMIA